MKIGDGTLGDRNNGNASIEILDDILINGFDNLLEAIVSHIFLLLRLC